MSAFALIAESRAAQIVGWALIHFLWQGALIAILLWAALVLLHRATANVRYSVCCLALALMSGCPIVSTALLSGRADGPTMRPASFAESMGATSISVASKSSILQHLPVDSVPQTASTHPDRGVSAQVIPWIVTGWLLGILALSLRLLGACAALHRLTRSRGIPIGGPTAARAAEIAARLGIRGRFDLREALAMSAPAVLGVFRVTVLIPGSVLTSMPPNQLEALLAHELAHVRRHDYLVNLWQTVVETLLFYHPAVWWVSHRIRIEREFACDDMALTVMGDRCAYARALTDLESLRSPQLTLAATGGPLLARIQRILGEPNMNSRTPSPWLAGWLVLALFTAGTVAFMRHAQAARVDFGQSPSILTQSRGWTHQQAQAPERSANLVRNSAAEAVAVEHRALSNAVAPAPDVELAQDAAGKARAKEDTLRDRAKQLTDAQAENEARQAESEKRLQDARDDLALAEARAQRSENEIANDGVQRKLDAERLALREKSRQDADKQLAEMKAQLAALQAQNADLKAQAARLLAERKQLDLSAAELKRKMRDLPTDERARLETLKRMSLVRQSADSVNSRRLEELKRAGFLRQDSDSLISKRSGELKRLGYLSQNSDVLSAQQLDDLRKAESDASAAGARIDLPKAARSRQQADVAQAKEAEARAQLDVLKAAQSKQEVDLTQAREAEARARLDMLKAVRSRQDDALLQAREAEDRASLARKQMLKARAAQSDLLANEIDRLELRRIEIEGRIRESGQKGRHPADSREMRRQIDVIRWKISEIERIRARRGAQLSREKQLLDLARRREEIRSRYTPDHPRARELENEIKRLQAEQKGR